MRRTSKIYISGHAGLVGSALYRELIKQGYENLIVRSHTQLDLTDQAQVDMFFSQERPEYVFLAAAKVGGIGANSVYPVDFMQDNLLIALNVIRAAHSTGVTRLLNLGSSCIYPKYAQQPIREEELLTGPLEPTNEPYAIAKIAALKLCAAYNKQYETDFLSLMPTNLYGPNDTYDLERSHVLPALLLKFHTAKMSGEDHVELWGDGTPLREFLYSDDLARAALFVMQSCTAVQIGTFINVGSGEEVSIAKLAETVRDVVYADVPGRNCVITWNTEMPNGTPRKLLDSSRIRELGWKPQVDINEGIRLSYKDMLSRNEHAERYKG